MIAIRGAASRIAVELQSFLPDGEEVVSVGRGQIPPYTADRYLFCQGLLRSKPMIDQTDAEVDEGLDVNAHQVMSACDVILGGNANARICVMGSESGFAGSFDGVYAAAKARLHSYVERRRLRYPGQQLVCIAPGIIFDTGMTQRRQDLEALDQRRMNHPKRRWLTAKEVAGLVYYCLYVNDGYLSNVVIRVNGGEHLWR